MVYRTVSSGAGVRAETPKACSACTAGKVVWIHLAPAKALDREHRHDQEGQSFHAKRAPPQHLEGTVTLAPFVLVGTVVPLLAHVGRNVEDKEESEGDARVEAVVHLHR